MPSDMPFRVAFGSWGKALIAAGFKPKKPYPSDLCRNKCVQAHKGKRSFAWKGGRVQNNFGYIEIWMPDHPNANKSGYIREHRLVMSEHIGRPLLKDEDVHHINGIKNDNRIENLQLLLKEVHTGNHWRGIKRKPKKEIRCVYPSCERTTSSSTKMCISHYKLQHQRKQTGIITDIHEFKEVSRRHSTETKKLLSDLAKQLPRKGGRFAKEAEVIGNIYEAE
jgi:hypothetical protein